MNLTQPLKSNKDDEHDVEVKDLNAKLLVCDVHEKGTKIDVVPM